MALMEKGDVFPNPNSLELRLYILGLSSDFSLVMGSSGVSSAATLQMQHHTEAANSSTRSCRRGRF